ncbi:MAG: site-specific integrase [Capsulimonas sp.]|uniref:tyrosine-type recombinase/integrase n=1 Tax=Capsulimonas sp. TaxID=2494211 RepID=UPI003264C399
MKKRVLPSRNLAAPVAPILRDSLSISDLKKYQSSWLLDCELRHHSQATLSNRRLFLDKLIWFAERSKYAQVGLCELKAFFVHFHSGHSAQGGRWGGGKALNTFRAPRPATVQTYHNHLRTFFRWCVDEDLLDKSPMERASEWGRKSAIPIPEDRADQIEPFSEEQIRALLAAAKASSHPKRNEAMLSMLLDTGMRVSELVDLELRDVDTASFACVIRNGKGGKRRTVRFGRDTKRKLIAYLKEEAQHTLGEPTLPVFASDRGKSSGMALTRNGVDQLLKRLGRAAQITTVRVSAHTCRHTFALRFLLAGGDAFALQQILGHEDMEMTQKYVKFANADIERQHRAFSPMDALKAKRQ